MREALVNKMLALLVLLLIEQKVKRLNKFDSRVLIIYRLAEARYCLLFKLKAYFLNCWAFQFYYEPTLDG